MKRLPSFLLLLLLFSCNKKDTEPFESVVGVWRFHEVMTATGNDQTALYDNTRLEIDAKEVRLYKDFVTPNGLVDSQIAYGIYDLHWGMVNEYLDPDYPDSATPVQYQMIKFAWATDPPYPYNTTFTDWHLFKKEPGKLHIRNAWKTNYYLEP